MIFIIDKPLYLFYLILLLTQPRNVYNLLQIGVVRFFFFYIIILVFIFLYVVITGVYLSHIILPYDTL